MDAGTFFSVLMAAGAEMAGGIQAWEEGLETAAQDREARQQEQEILRRRKTNPDAPATNAEAAQARALMKLMPPAEKRGA